MKYQAFFFDLDGTLVNSFNEIRESMNGALRSMGLKELEDSFFEEAIGWGTRALARDALNQLALLQDIPQELELEARYIQNYEEIITRNVPEVYPGIQEALQDLEKAGIPLFILSNRGDDLVQHTVRLAFPNIKFSEVKGLKAPFEAKPHPGQVRAMLKRAQLEAQHTLFVGDSSIDMQLALNAGMTGLGVAWGISTQRDNLLEAGAKFIVHHPQEWLNFIESPFQKKQ